MQQLDQDYDCIVLASGGIDSTVVTAQLVLAESKPLQLFIKHGTNVVDDRQEAAARQIAELYNLPFFCMDVPQLFSGFWTSGLYKDRETPDIRYMPGYRFFLYMIGLAVADWTQLSYIYSGDTQGCFIKNNNGDADVTALQNLIGMKDLRETWFSTKQEFTQFFSRTYREGYPNSFKMMDPLMGYTKPQIIRLGARLKAPLELTITCRSPIEMPEGTSHCGKTGCYWCDQRKLGFREAEIPDPTAYMVDEPPGYDVDMAAIKKFEYGRNS